MGNIFGKHASLYVKRVFIGFIVILFIIIIGLVLFKKRMEVRPYQSIIEENKLLMNGLSLTYVIDNTSYVNLLSKAAYVDILQKSVDMIDVNLKYDSKNTKVEAKADTGKYELERFLSAYGNLSGKMNDMTFLTGKSGEFTYDYRDGLGSVNNGITVFQGKSNIKAKKASFDVKQNYILFEDNVTVEYVL